MWPSTSPRSGSRLPLHPPSRPLVLGLRVPAAQVSFCSSNRESHPTSGLWTSRLRSGVLLCKLLIRYHLLREAPSGLKLNSSLFPQAAGSAQLFCHLPDRCLLVHCLLNLGLPTGRQNLGRSLSSLWSHQLQLEWGLAFNKYLVNGWMNE